MHILVTGGAGYIGSHVVKQLLEESRHRVTILDNLSTGHRSTVDTLGGIDPSRLRFVERDLSDFAAVESLFREERFDAVIHFAASIVVPESVANPLKYYMNNTVNTTHLVKMCSDFGVGKFIFSSTATVYGDLDVTSLNMRSSDFKLTEEMPTAPINPYGWSKLMSERVIRDTAAANGNFHYVILRYFNVAGADPKNRIGQSFPDATHLIKVAAQTAIGAREKISIFGEDYDTPDGTCLRDYIHVEDLASAHLKALSYLETEQHREPNIFNVGYGRGFSVIEVIETMKTVSGVDFRVESAPRRAGDPARLVADNRRARELLRWEPRYDDLATICRTALAWEARLTRE